jgi:UDP-N-acetylmuramate dehydrogenase
LESVRVVRFSGEVETLTKKEISFGYRSSGLRHCVIVEAFVNLPTQDRSITQKLLDEYRDARAKTQDLWHASAGCMFKNPKDLNVSSGKLIDDAGLKGRRVGKAQVSEKHGNFIINLGGATAEDVRILIEEVRRGVYERFKVNLETEVKIL